MTATTPSTAIATIQPAFTDAKRLALAGFLAGYRGLTREGTRRTWPVHPLVQSRSLPLFSIRRTDIETFVRELEARGQCPRDDYPAAVLAFAGFYKYAVEEELLKHSPVAHVRRSRLD
jgi:hypothetical protein